MTAPRDADRLIQTFLSKGETDGLAEQAPALVAFAQGVIAGEWRASGAGRPAKITARR